MARIVIEEGDLSEVAADAIVNADDPRPSLALGQVALAGGGEPPARHVIHAAALEPGGSASEDSLRAVTRGALELARERGFRSLALPAIGSGAGGLPLARCAQVMLEETQAHLRGATSLEEVRFVLRGEPALRVFEQVHDQSRIAAQLARLREARQR